MLTFELHLHTMNVGPHSNLQAKEETWLQELLKKGRSRIALSFKGGDALHGQVCSK